MEIGHLYKTYHGNQYTIQFISYRSIHWAKFHLYLKNIFQKNIFIIYLIYYFFYLFIMKYERCWSRPVAYLLQTIKTLEKHARGLRTGKKKGLRLQRHFKIAATLWKILGPWNSFFCHTLARVFFELSNIFIFIIA